MIKLISVLMLLFSFSIFTQAQEKGKPNIIFIVADDLGYSDLGCYGGEIKTPNLDKLAYEGVRLSNMHNASMCILSRSSFLTGKWWPTAGKGITKSDNIAQKLKKEGYNTSLVGKWHLDGEPNDKGFDNFFGFLGGFSSFYTGSKDYRLNRVPFTNFPKDFYSTDAFTDKAIDFLSTEQATKAPFFLYMSYQAPHNPLQAPKEDIMKYRGKYLKGWQAVREERIKNQIKMGIINIKSPLPAYPQNLPQWDSLSDAQKDLEDLRMATYAAMIERMDLGVGKLMEALENSGQKDNTFIIFISDNGTDPFSVVDEVMLKKGLLPGDANSNYQPGTGWAYAAVTPYRLYKISQHGGGVKTGAIAWGPGIFKQSNAIISAPLHIVDVVPTVLAMVKPDVKEATLNSSFSGKSFLDLLNGKKYKSTNPMFFQYMDNRAIRTDKWTLVEVDGEGWELYNRKKDPFEVNNLIAKCPKTVDDLQKTWLNWWITESGNKSYKPESTKTGPNYDPQGDRGSGPMYQPSAMPSELSNKYKNPN